jgi:deoxyribonuclease (pyrimidine dimer)|tara:strand:+ start:62 stop:517 length:456 start_codon:yes stop_codon:yes gene_type:complete
LTRINIIDPSELTDQHLIAEYREIFMVGSSLQRSLKSKSWDIKSIPKQYTLNKGHVKFFYDKGKYLSKRYDDLRKEMKARGMNPDDTRVFKREQWPNELWNDWTPRIEDYKIIRKRIQEKIDMKPHWYRKTNYLQIIAEKACAICVFYVIL